MLLIRIHKYEVRIRIQILLSISKNSKKNLDCYCFEFSDFFMTFYIKIYVNVASKSEK
jgi:hypothetical protein